jgi:hypothetical protein
LLHPAAGHGVRCVSGSRIPVPRSGEPNRGGRTDTVLAAHFTPPEGILASSRTTSPWPLPPCRSRCPRSTREARRCQHTPRAPRDHHVDFEALLRRRVRTTLDRCRPRDALSFHGLCSPSRSFSRMAASERATRVVTTANHPKKSRQIDTRLRSAPRQRPRAAGPAHRPCGRGTRGRPIRAIRRALPWPPGPDTMPFRRTTPSQETSPHP